MTECGWRFADAMKLLLGLLFVSFTAHAETSLVVSVASLHFDDGEHCGVNPGLGLEHGLTKRTRLVAGQYSNSDCRASGYLGLSYTAWKLGNWKLGSALVGFTGYDKKEKDGQREDKVILVPLGVISYERKTWGVNLLYIPPDGGDFRGALGLQLKFPLR